MVFLYQFLISVAAITPESFTVRRNFFVLPAVLGSTYAMEKLLAPLAGVAVAAIPVALLVDKLCDVFSGVIPSGHKSSKRSVSFSSVESAMRAYNRTSTKCVGGVKQHGSTIIVQLSGIHGYSASGWEAAQVRTHLESWLGVNLDRTNISIYY